MSLYPSLEDMKVDQILQQDQQPKNQQPTNRPINGPLIYPGTNPSSLYYNAAQPSAPAVSHPSASLYPTMDLYNGIDLTPTEIAIIERQQQQLASLQLAQTRPNEIATIANKHFIAPLSGNSVGLKRATVTNGVREVTLCKGADQKLGMRLKSINNAIFVVLVAQGSPAALAGLRFGDQMLQINETYVAGMSHQSVHSMIKKLSGERITFSVRDRPLERTITLHKDNGGEAGFVFSNGKITSIVKDSSAARNGLLTDSQILEINGQNVVGLPDKKVKEYIQNSENTLTLTIMPTVLFEKIMQNMHSSLVKKLMDHTIFDY